MEANKEDYDFKRIKKIFKSPTEDSVYLDEKTLTRMIRSPEIQSKASRLTDLFFKHQFSFNS